jgi:hypothetical protein
MSYGTVHRYALIAAGKLSIVPAPGRSGPSAMWPHPRLGGCAASIRHPGSVRSRHPSLRLRRSAAQIWLLSYGRPPWASSRPAEWPGACAVTSKTTLPQPPLAAEGSNRHPAPCRLTDRPLPKSCLLHITLSVAAHPTPPPWANRCALRPCSPTDQLSRRLSGRNFIRGRWVHRTDTLSAMG